MGLGLAIAATIKAEGLFRRVPSQEDVLRRLESALAALTPPEIRYELMWISRDADGLAVGLHPAEEPVTFRFTESGALRCEARTSGAGPGYHAFLVDLLEKIGKQAKLHWQWAGEGLGDDTGYHEHRDVARLQSAMTDWLRTVGEKVLELGDGSRHIKVSMPVEYPSLASDDGTAMTVMGPRGRDWFERLRGADAVTAPVFGAEHFPWWTPGLDAACWRNCGLVIAWVDLPWHAPVDDDERQRYTTALRCFTRAKELDAAIALPQADIADIETLLNTPGAFTPDPTRIGYLRRPLKMPVTGDWTITLPGYYYVRWEDDGRRQVFSYGTRAVYLTTLTVGSRSENAAFEERLLSSIKAQSEDGQLLKMQQGHLNGRAGIAQAEEHGERFWTLTGYVATTSYLAMITVAFDDDADRDWAIATWESLYHLEG